MFPNNTRKSDSTFVRRNNPIPPVLRQKCQFAMHTLGEEHPDPETLSTMHELAVRFRKQGNLTWARGLFERVLAIQRRELGPRHADVVSNEENLSETLCALGEFDRARVLQRSEL